MTAPNLRPSIIQRTDKWPPCCEVSRPPPYLWAFVIVVGLAIAVRVVA